MPGLRLTRRSLVGFAGLALFAASSARAADRVGFADIWEPGGGFSGRAKALAGQTVEMRGYMAPPLKPEVDFFVLANVPMTVCPFCDSAAAWPEDIVLILLERPVHAVDYDRLISVTGTLELGTETDEATGFVSRVRLRAARYHKV